MPTHIFENTAADFRSGLASNKQAEFMTCSGFHSVEQLTLLTEEETCDTVLEWIRLWFSATSDCSSLSQKTPVRMYMMGQYVWVTHTKEARTHTHAFMHKHASYMRNTWEEPWILTSHT